MSPQGNEREFRQILSQKVSGTLVGMWLLIPEYLRLGVWDILKGWTKSTNMDFDPRIALQMVNESAICVNRIRKKNSLGHQGFQLANGMSRLITDEQAHFLLNKHTMKEAENLFINLGHQRALSGHYLGDIIAIDPHRIITTSKRRMPKKKKRPCEPAQKMLQTFFSLCTQTGQPIMATMSSTGMPTTRATKNLVNATQKIIPSQALIIADKEHFTSELLNTFRQHPNFNLLAPTIKTKKIMPIINKLAYKPLWAGYAMAETDFYFKNNDHPFRLIAQRTGENAKNYTYDAFITTSNKDAQQLITQIYDQRWSIEEFFRFENRMGLKRASTLNLNIRYGKLALAMIAQAATYQLRGSLNSEYKKWDAPHLANEILAWQDGDIKVKDDTIIVTMYGTPKHLNIENYRNLPQQLQKQNINPKIPWLYDFKLDFRFR